MKNRVPLRVRWSLAGALVILAAVAIRILLLPATRDEAAIGEQLRALREKLRDTTPCRSATPPERNPFVKGFSSEHEFARLARTDGEGITREMISSFFEGPLVRREERPLISEWVHRNRGFLAEVSDVVRREDCRLWKIGWDVSRMVDFVFAREVVDSLAARARFSAAGGDAREALDDVVTLLRLSRLLKAGGPGMGWAIGGNAELRAWEIFSAWPGWTRNGREILLGLRDAVSDLPSQPRPVDHFLEAMSLVLVAVPDIEATRPGLTHRFLEVVEDLSRRLEHVLTEPGRNGAEVIRDFHELLNGLEEQARSWSVDRGKRMATALTAFSLRRGYVRHYYESAARHALLETALEMAIDGSGGAPARSDPFSGEAIRRAETESGVILYSVGRDGADDGGDPEKDISLPVVLESRRR